MSAHPNPDRTRPSPWTLALIIVIVGMIVLTWALFTGALTSYVTVTLTSERAGLVMDENAKVKLRGVTVGRVKTISAQDNAARLELELFPDQVGYIPANVDAQISATTAFGSKYVELTYPKDPTPQHLSSGAVLHARNVSTEVNTVFESLVDLMHQIDPAKLNAVLTALSDGFRGRGQQIGNATTAAKDVLVALNEHQAQFDRVLNSVTAFGNTYSAAASDILKILDAATTTSATVVKHQSALDAVLLNTLGLARSGSDLIGPNQENLVDSINLLEPTTELLLKYNPVYTCTLVGSKWFLDNGGTAALGGNGRTALLDIGLLLGNDPYVYPDNLPIVAAKGGPGGKPGCGSLPRADLNYPVRQLVTNTGWGTGVDVRNNPGLGHPCFVNYLPVTRAVPEPPSVRCQGPPSPGLPDPPPGPLPFATPPAGPEPVAAVPPPP